MRAQLEDLATDGPTEEEMTRVRGQVRGGVVLGLEDNWSRMMRLGRSEIIGRYRPIDESLAEFDAVEAADVRALAASLITKLDCHPRPARAVRNGGVRYPLSIRARRAERGNTLKTATQP